MTETLTPLTGSDHVSTASWQQLKHVVDNWGLCLQYRQIDPRYHIAARQICNNVINPKLLTEQNFDGSRDYAMPSILKTAGIEVADVVINPNFL